MGLRTYLEDQMAWSNQTFGPGRRTLGITSHIEEELKEVKAKPEDLSEWIDIIILALDGYWRHGGSPDNIMKELRIKQRKNFARKWLPPGPEDRANKHIAE